MEKQKDIINLYTELFNLFFNNSDNIKTQVNLLKNKDMIIKKIDFINKKYDELINEIQS